MVDSVASAIRAALPNAGISIVAASNEQLADIGDVPHADTYIIDIDQFRGPVGGLHTAVVNSDAEWIFVAACDMPLLSADFIAFLVEQIDASCDVVLPIQLDGRPQPLAAFYRIEALQKQFVEFVEKACDSPSLLAAIDPLRLKHVGFEEYHSLRNSQQLLKNVNSAEDLLT